MSRVIIAKSVKPLSLTDPKMHQLGGLFFRRFYFLGIIPYYVKPMHAT